MKRKQKPRLWSVSRIKHPKHPKHTVRIAEYEPGGTLHLFRWINGKQRSHSLNLRRADLGESPKAQIHRAHQLGCEIIEEIAAKPTANLVKGAQARETLTLSQLLDRYEVDGFAGRSAPYKRDALSGIRRISKFLGSALPVPELKPSHVQKYLASRTAEGHAPAGRSDLMALSIGCNWAVGEELLDENPLASKRSRDAMRIQHEPARPFVTAARYELLKAVAHQLPEPFDVLLDIAWHTGHRIGAILELRWEHVSFDQTASAPHGTIRWYAGKASDRKKHDHTLPMNEKARAALLAWRKQLHAIPAGWIFASNDGQSALPKWGPKKWMRKAETLAKVPHLKQGIWHPFRRGWATARKHMPLQDVAAGGGWTDTATVTKCYQHATEEETRAATVYVA
jgi:integrase